LNPVCGRKCDLANRNSSHLRNYLPTESSSTWIFEVPFAFNTVFRRSPGIRLNWLTSRRLRSGSVSAFMSQAVRSSADFQSLRLSGLSSYVDRRIRLHDRDVCSTVAQSWLVLRSHKDPFYLGLDLFLGQLPFMLFSLVGGRFRDRLDRRRMLLSSQLHSDGVRLCVGTAVLYACGQSLHILTLSLSWASVSLRRTSLFPLASNSCRCRGLSNAHSMNSHPVSISRASSVHAWRLAYTALGATWCPDQRVSYLL